jgi:hypothetical protein
VAAILGQQAVAVEIQCEERRDEGDDRYRARLPQAVARERGLCRRGEGRDENDGNHTSAGQRKARYRESEHQRRREHRRNFQPGSRRRPSKMVLMQNRIDHGGQPLDTRHHRSERRLERVARAERIRPDQDDAIAKHRFIIFNVARMTLVASEPALGVPRCREVDSWPLGKGRSEA